MDIFLLWAGAHSYIIPGKIQDATVKHLLNLYRHFSQPFLPRVQDGSVKDGDGDSGEGDATFHLRHLRRRYRTWLAGILLTAGLVISYLGLRNNFRLEQLTLTVLAPIAPMILWGIREFQGNGDAADVSDRLREKSRELWAAAIDGKLSDEVLRARARPLQSEIYARRVDAPLIFHWVYRLLRTAGEEHMNVAANELVREARAHGF